ncbi:MAG: ABC transporter ATP-binding protein, partial [Nitrospirota bacterium]|nr:ABC transporter ATP-binding protein [Nitrospirota bacterium]
MAMQPTQADDRAALRWLFGFVRPHTARLARVLAIALVTTGLVLLQPWLTKLLIDQGILAGDMQVLVIVCLLMLSAALIAALLGWLNRYQHVAVSADILFALRLALFRHLELLSPHFYARWRSGDLLARLDGDVAEIQRFGVDAVLAAVSATIGLIGALALMLALSWRLSLIAFVLLPAEWVFLRLMRPKIEATTRVLRERSSDLSAFFVERLPAIKMIQSMAAEEREAAGLDTLQTRFRGDLL